ncbi:hypothetical protein BOTCAL_0098g00100 [Botryotinia calthae]|uniref:Uncharacterized protein n=1 Tax=Botryotinia calthae TaxID=38488 RepID=A0A4Y8D8R5_9HELO|nr:hypothetical protein BOTCAL_0098g00100 [Botryotinia calthae]
MVDLSEAKQGIREYSRSMKYNCDAVVTTVVCRVKKEHEDPSSSSQRSKFESEVDIRLSQRANL